MLASQQVNQPCHSSMTLEKQGENPAVSGKNIGADLAKEKLVEAPSSKGAIQLSQQIGSSEEKKQCPHCAVICSSSSDLAIHTKFWHSNISTKSESSTGSKEKEKAQVVQCQRKLRQQNLSNFRGYKCYRCTHCPVLCDSQDQLNTHMSLCHSDANRPAVPVMSIQTGDNQKKVDNKHLICNQCGFTCDMEDQFMVHMKKHKQSLSMNQRNHQEMAYQQKVKMEEIKQLKVKVEEINQQKVKMEEIKQLKEMQRVLTNIEETQFGKGWGSRAPSTFFSGRPPLKGQSKWADERKIMMQPGGKRSFDESEELFSRRTGQAYSQCWKPKVVKDYSKEVKAVRDYLKEPKIKQAGTDPPHVDLSCALKKQKTEERKFEKREGEIFQPKVFNYPGSGAPKQDEVAEKPQLEEGRFGEGMPETKDGASNVEKEKSEDRGGGHWRKRLVGLC